MTNKKSLMNIVIIFCMLILTHVSAVSAETYTNVSLYNHDPISGIANWGAGKDTFGQLYTNIFYPSYDNIIKKNLYNHDPISGIANWGAGKDTFGQLYTNILYTSYDNIIRQNGYIEYVNFNCENKSQLSEYYINIWRKDGNTYTLMYMSENLVSQIKNGSNTLWLNDSVFVREGDYVGESLKGSGVSGYAFYAPSYGTFQYFYGLDKLHTSYNRDFKSFTPSLSMMTHPIEICMKSPSVVFIGDSICAGHPGHYSFLEARSTTNLNSSYEYHFGKLSGLSYQNMGIGSQTTTQIRARFQNDVINQHPDYALIEGGVNDVGLGASNESILANWEFMLSECVNNSIQPVVILILPWTNGNASQTAQVNYINKQLMILSSKYNATVIDARDELGVYDEKNDKWSIKPEYNADDVHFNTIGYIVLGQEISNIMCQSNNNCEYFNDWNLNK